MYIQVRKLTLISETDLCNERQECQASVNNVLKECVDKMRY